MRIPYAFHLASTGALEITENEAEVIRMIFDYYLAGASLGKVVDLLYEKQISSPTGKANRHGLRLTICSQTPNTLQSLAWNAT